MIFNNKTPVIGSAAAGKKMPSGGSRRALGKRMKTNGSLTLSNAPTQ